jgi:hypothetical protein
MRHNPTAPSRAYQIHRIRRSAFVAHDLAELGPLYDDIAAATLMHEETARLTMSEVHTGKLIDHLQKKARRLPTQPWAIQLRSLCASVEAETIHLMSGRMI